MSVCCSQPGRGSSIRNGKSGASISEWSQNHTTTTPAMDIEKEDQTSAHEEIHTNEAVDDSAVGRRSPNETNDVCVEERSIPVESDKVRLNKIRSASSTYTMRVITTSHVPHATVLFRTPCPNQGRAKVALTGTKIAGTSTSNLSVLLPL